MYPVSERFAAAVRTSHRAMSWVEIVGTGEIVTGWFDASVSMDSTALVRAGFSMKIADPTGYYIDRGLGDDPLSRFGVEVRPWRGVVFEDDTVEAVPLGVYRIETNDPTEVRGGYELDIRGRDRSSLINRKSPRPIVVANGTPLNDAIASIIAAMYPAATFDLTEVPWNTGAMLIEAGGNPWEKAVELAAGSGLVLFCDRNGVFCSVPGLDPSNPVSWVFDEGEECTFTDIPSVGRGSGSPIPNGYIVKGTSSSSSSSGIHGEAWDNDPRSPTWRGGRYGEIVEIVQTDKVRNNEQAQQAAELLLRRAMGGIQSMSFSAIVNPALDPYDIVWARRSSIGVDRAWYMANLTIPLDVKDSMTGALGYHSSAAEAAVESIVGGLLSDTSS